MTLVADVKTRIASAVADLSGRVEEAAELAALVRDGALPQRSPAAFVLPLGLDGREPGSVAGLFRQNVDETIAVVLVLQALGDPKAQRALTELATLIDQVVNAVCGFQPAGAIAPLQLRRGRLVSVSAGTIIYQIDFALPKQLRIT